MYKNTFSLLKTIILIILYIFNLNIVSTIFNFLNLDTSNITFLADAIYFGIIVLINFKYLIEQFKDMKNNTKKKVSSILLCFILVLLINFIFNFMHINYDNLNNYSNFYIIFKMLLFSTLAEELLFKKTIREVINIDYLFMLASSFIYAFITIIYSDLTSISTWLLFLWYFSIELIMSYFYVKHENILVPITSKFIYNFIKVILLLTGVF